MDEQFPVFLSRDGFSPHATCPAGGERPERPGEPLCLRHALQVETTATWRVSLPVTCPAGGETTATWRVSLPVTCPAGGETTATWRASLSVTCPAGGDHSDLESLSACDMPCRGETRATWRASLGCSVCPIEISAPLCDKYNGHFSLWRPDRTNRTDSKICHYDTMEPLQTVLL